MRNSSVICFLWNRCSRLLTIWRRSAGRENASCSCCWLPLTGDRQGGVLVVLHDVTQQRKTQDMQREFVANVSHELRTPLTNIRSYAETLSDSAGELPPTTEKKFLGVILNESDRMTHIVQDLLTLSRFDSGKDELHLVRFPFDVAVQDLYNAVYMEAQRHDHKMKLRLEPDLPAIVADRERVLQVMMNIVSNSIKYTPNGGHILVSAGREGDRVWMQVDDDGIGIPPKDRPRIFERFYRVDKARSRQSGGTGRDCPLPRDRGPPRGRAGTGGPGRTRPVHAHGTEDRGSQPCLRRIKNW